LLHRLLNYTVVLTRAWVHFQRQNNTDIQNIY